MYQIIQSVCQFRFYQHLKGQESQVWWCTPVIPALRKLTQVEGELGAILGYL
jgi:hypothetical protein